MRTEFVTSKVMLRPSGDDRLSYGNGLVKVIMFEGELLPEPIFVNPDPEAVVSVWEQLRAGRESRQNTVRPNNPVHQQPNQKHSGPRPDAAGCTVASDGLHSWMKNGLHPVSKKQRWRCLRCRVADCTEGEA